MFGFGNKKNQPQDTTDKKDPPSASLRRAGEAVPSVTVPSEIIDTISRLQKELDRLKLAMAKANIAMPKDNGSAVDKTLDDLKSRDDAMVKSENERVIEGVFDGEGMIGADGGRYDVPANYASKSKLVEGDILKLTINNLGAFVYKQIKPIERVRLIGALEQDFHNLQYYAAFEGKKWKLLTASVTYFKGEEGDEVVFLIPAESGSKWAAVENIIKR